jgi:hypothetical protein
VALPGNAPGGASRLCFRWSEPLSCGCVLVGLARFELATLDPQIGPPQLPSVNLLSLASIWLTVDVR